MVSSISQLLLLAASLTPAYGFCGSRTHLAKRAEGEAVKVSTFGYTGSIGPLNWAALDAANTACSTGTQQSPIDMTDGQFNIVPAAEVELTMPDFPAGIKFENLGTTVEGVTEGAGGKLVMAGVEFESKQFHFHHPSEHLDNGTSISMEMHMVFQSADSQIAVIGVYVDLDTGAATTPAARRRQETVKLMPVSAAADVAPVQSVMLETLFESVGEIATPGTETTSKPLVMSELVNTIKAGNFQAYSGSLTTPPCSEGVSWMVATQKLKISTASFEKVRDVVQFNSRFPQNTLGQPNVLSFARGATA